MNADESLTRAISEWQHKHHIADRDPMIAALELVRIYLRHSRETDNDPAASPPSFEIFAAPWNCSTAVRKHSSTKLPISSVSCDALATTSLASTEHASSRIACARHLVRSRVY